MNIFSIDLENIVNETFTFTPIVISLFTYSSYGDSPYTYAGSTWSELVPNTFTNNAFTVTSTTI